MRIASFNINGVKARLPRLLEWLEETQPDVACLQEVKSQDEGFPVADFEHAGYGAIWHGQKAFNGVAILAKGAQPVEAQRTLPVLALFWVLTLGIEVQHLRMGWRSGLLKKSLPGIYGSFRTGGPRRKAQRERSALSLLHGVALISGVIWLL